MEIQLKRGSTTPLYKQLRNNIRDQILSGQLADGFKLPSERQLVEKLQVHRNTIKKAYEMLIHEGLVYASVKSPRGYFVRNSLAEARPDNASEAKRPFSSLDKNFNYHFLGLQNTFQRLYNSSYLSDAIPFARRPFRWSISTKYSGKSLQREPRSRSGFVIPKTRSG